jgi:dCMP deaminase
MDLIKAARFMHLASTLATLSKDQNKQVGALLLDPDTLFIKSSGYNGFPINIRDDPDRWQKENKSSYVQHAEMNAICSAARHGTPLNNSICIVTYHPCSTCAKALIQAGVKQIITHKPDYSHPRWGIEFERASQLFKEANIQITLI